MRVRLRTLLILSHLLVAAVPIVTLVASGALDHDLLETRRAELEREGALIARLVERAGPFDPASAAVGADLRWAATATGAGVRLLDRSGTIRYASGPGLGAEVGDRPEVIAALGGRIASRTTPGAPSSDRPAHEADGPLGWLFVAVPIQQDGAVQGAVLLSRRTREDVRFLREVVATTPPSVAVALGATLALGVAVAAWIGRAFGRLSDAARHIAASHDRSALAAAEAGAPVTEVAALAASVRGMADRLDERARRQESFAAHTAHEFKTPLSTLRGTVQILTDDPDLPDPMRRRFLENAATDLDRLDRMVDGLLALARAEDGSGPRVEVDLGALARRLADGFGDTVVVEGTGTTRGVEAWLERAIDNLIDNGLEHGLPPVRVTVSNGLVAVTDQGSGVPAELRATVFERFFTTSADRRGTGLGLPLTRAIAEAHGGTLTLASDGRTFVLNLG